MKALRVIGYIALAWFIAYLCRVLIYPTALMLLGMEWGGVVFLASLIVFPAGAVFGVHHLSKRLKERVDKVE